MGVLCQLESEGPFRAEVIKWMPGYDDAGPSPGPEPDAGIAPDTGAEPGGEAADVVAPSW
jgi:hypothetical protein